MFFKFVFDALMSGTFFILYRTSDTVRWQTTWMTYTCQNQYSGSQMQIFAGTLHCS